MSTYTFVHRYTIPSSFYCNKQTASEPQQISTIFALFSAHNIKSRFLPGAALYDDLLNLHLIILIL